MVNKHAIVLTIVLLAGLGLRLWNIDFGLPHSYYADEPEIGELAIKYTYELKNIIRNNDIYKLAPGNYVYGTFPVYVFTILVMGFSKALNLFNINFAKMDLYVFMRTINALISFSIIPIYYLLLRRFDSVNNKLFLLAGAFLVSFNWKLIVHAHYLNHDILITLLLLLANMFFLTYLKRSATTENQRSSTKYVILFAISFGLAVSTKITALITLPVFYAVYIVKKDWESAVATLAIILGCFALTNPFSIVFFNDFLGRLIEMRTKEAGMVFDSVDYSFFKYLKALAYLCTLPVFLLSVYGSYKTLTGRLNNVKSLSHTVQFLLILLAQIVIYLTFFTVQNRRVDRWMLPVLPNVLFFSVVGLQSLQNLSPKIVKVLPIILLGAGSYYLYFPYILMHQFQRNTPKSSAYLWLQRNLPETSTKFGLTEEGLDPLNKLSLSTIWQYNAYESKAGQKVTPPDPLMYDYIIISSRPREWTAKREVADKYPDYYLAWKNFFSRLEDASQFSLVKTFETTTPNLIPLSSVYIYKKVN